MAELFSILFILITVTSISLVLFGGWVTVLSVKGVARLIGMLVLGTTITPKAPRLGSTTCERCAQVNPKQARFCRRCGARFFPMLRKL